MGLFNLKKKEQPKTMVEQVLALAEPLIINGYRRIGANGNSAISSKTSDKKIIEIYTQVGSAFKEASKQRNEHIPAGFLNTIVLFFLVLNETNGEIFYNEHLKYEVDNYIKGGLRPDYKRELKLF